ncbi:hypothetical protein RB195_007275 [Necator americanus]|uniref:Uncharacterized protein n=1 Tax=Necator americanus TaxID=51031 RepID=A0ABR1BWM9_NECAM
MSDVRSSSVAAKTRRAGELQRPLVLTEGDKEKEGGRKGGAQSAERRGYALRRAGGRAGGLTATAAAAAVVRRPPRSNYRKSIARVCGTLSSFVIVYELHNSIG